MTRNGSRGEERSLLLFLRRVGGGELSSSSTPSTSPSPSYGSVGMPSLKSLMSSRRAAMGPVPVNAAASTSQAAAAAATAPLLQRSACPDGSPLAGPSQTAGVFLKRRRDSLEGSAGSDSDAPMPLLRAKGPSCSSLPRVPAISVSPAETGELRKCETVVTLSNLMLNQQPLRPVNRLRVPPPTDLPPSRVCSRCSSLLSMAGSSSRYSLNTSSGTFVPSGSSSALNSGSITLPPPPTILCKLCLLEVPMPDTVEILRCSCCYCRECIKAYVEFEINEAAYDISCPDAQCENEGVITLQEVARLVSSDMMDKYHRFRLNTEVDLDASRTWCPRAGCETVCTVCSTGGCVPQAVHCPTCSSNFCSNCRGSWHAGLSCEDQASRRPNGTDRGGPSMHHGIPFDSDLIKCCPMCNVPIEKDEGCAQMMCKRCKHVFCWYCLASLDDDFLLRHYDKGPCKNKLGHSRASVIWHRTQVIGIFAGFGILLLVASPLLLLAAPCIVCCKCRVCSGGTKLDADDDLPDVP